VVEAWVAASGVERIDVAKPGNPTKTLRGGFASLDAAWYLLYARYLHTCGRARDALALAEAVVVSGGYVGVERMHLGARCTIAMARRSLGQEERAREELVAVLAEAMPQRIVRFIVDHGRDMGRLLREVYRDLAADDPLRDYVARLVLAAEADGRETSDGGGAIPPVQPLLDPLTERELDVVRLVAEGLTNREIADRLVVAVSTVKTHLNRAYAKLGVGNRTEAAARARELDMLNDVT